MYRPNCARLVESRERDGKGDLRFLDSKGKFEPFDRSFLILWRTADIAEESSRRCWSGAGCSPIPLSLPTLVEIPANAGKRHNAFLFAVRSHYRSAAS